jgi:hypothetical protein
MSDKGKGKGKGHGTAVIQAVMLAALFAAQGACSQEDVDPALTEVWEPEPPAIDAGADDSPPSDAIVLIGDDLSAWTKWDGQPTDVAASDAGNDAAGWEIEDGVVTVLPDSGGIRTIRRFGSVQLHLEWRAPVMEGSGQQKGNSGVFLQERYEVQILDSFDNRTYSNGQAASIYKQHIPLVNAARPPGQWQSYDILFDAPRFDDGGKLVAPAYITVLHNGVLVQHHVEIEGSTEYRGEPAYEAHGDAPLALQDHGDRVSFRNVWIRAL